MKNTLWTYLAMLTVVTVLTACAKQKEGRGCGKKDADRPVKYLSLPKVEESRKLGDIPIALYDEETILKLQTNIRLYLQKGTR